MTTQERIQKARDELYKRVDPKTAEQAKRDSLLRLILASEAYRPKRRRGGPR